MGNIKSFCCKDTASDIDDQEDRARILPSNCGDYYAQNHNNSNNNSIVTANSNEDNTSYGSTNSNGNGTRSMEQSVLDKIYQKMAANVIDVAPGDSMVIQQAEFLERQKAYQAKLSQFRSPLPLKLGNHHHHHHQNQHQIPKHVSSSFETKVPTPSSSSTSTNSTYLAPAHNATCPTLSTTNNTTINSANTTINTSTGSGNHLSPTNVTMMNNTNINRIQEKRSVEYEPIGLDEIQIIKEICSKSVSAIKNLKINSKEQVVTVFKP